VNRILIRLDSDTTKALALLAELEYRDISGQAAQIVRQELKRRGLIERKYYEKKYLNHKESEEPHESK